MAMSYLMTGRYIPYFGLNSLYLYFPLLKFFRTLPHNENEIARHFELVKSQGCSDGFPIFCNLLFFYIYWIYIALTDFNKK